MAAPPLQIMELGPDYTPQISGFKVWVRETTGLYIFGDCLPYK